MVAVARQRGPITILLTLCAFCLLVLANSACSHPTPPDSGIEGQVIIGPISPVSRPGEPNTKPFAADISFRRLSDGRVVASVRSGEDGAFRVVLAPGRYRVEPKRGEPLPIAPPQDVTVIADRFTRVRIDYDSGIR